MPNDLAFRDADPSEDDELARIMYNAFLPIWNHNWFQCLTEPLDLIPAGNPKPLTALQTRRLAFYRSWMSLNRAYNGDVTVAYTPAADSTGAPSDRLPSSPLSEEIAAVCLLLPPHKRASWSDPLTAWRVGFLQGLFGLSLRGFWRVCFVFEENVGRMIGKGLKDRGIEEGKEERLLFCQGCVRNPEWKGRGPARKLLDWAIRRRWEGQKAKGEKLTPVWLDTTIDDGVRAYEEAGFMVVGECMLKTGADEKGIRLGEEAEEKEREAGTRVAKQRVMVRLPEE